MKNALAPRPYLARLRTAATAAAVFCVLPAPALAQDGIQVLETQHNKSQVEFQDVNREIALTEKRLAEIAEALSITPNAVSVSLNRAVEAIRQRLAAIESSAQETQS